MEMIKKAIESCQTVQELDDLMENVISMINARKQQISDLQSENIALLDKQELPKDTVLKMTNRFGRTFVAKFFYTSKYGPTIDFYEYSPDMIYETLRPTAFSYTLCTLMNNMENGVMLDGSDGTSVIEAIDIHRVKSYILELFEKDFFPKEVKEELKPALSKERTYPLTSVKSEYKGTMVLVVK